MLSQNQGATSAKIDKSGLKDFEQIAREYGVDFDVRKDKSVNLPRYMVFVRAKDSDVFEAICNEHNERSLSAKKHPSVLKQLSKLKAIVAAIPNKVREKKQERDL